MRKKSKGKKEVYFIAARARNQPIDVTFYTKKGERVAFEAVEKVRTKQGVRFFAVAK